MPSGHEVGKPISSSTLKCLVSPEHGFLSHTGTMQRVFLAYLLDFHIFLSITKGLVGVKSQICAGKGDSFKDAVSIYLSRCEAGSEIKEYRD